MEREIEDYKSARREGIQPSASNPRAVRYAVEQSDKFGKPFNAANPLAHLPED
jgi:hypothetical protein